MIYNILHSFPNLPKHPGADSISSGLQRTIRTAASNNSFKPSYETEIQKNTIKIEWNIKNRPSLSFGTIKRFLLYQYYLGQCRGFYVCGSFDFVSHVFSSLVITWYFMIPFDLNDISECFKDVVWLLWKHFLVQKASKMLQWWGGTFFFCSRFLEKLHYVSI